MLIYVVFVFTLNKLFFVCKFFINDVNVNLNEEDPDTLNGGSNIQNTPNLFEPITPSLVSNKSDLNGAYTYDYVTDIFYCILNITNHKHLCEMYI